MIYNLYIRFAHASNSVILFMQIWICEQSSHVKISLLLFSFCFLFSFFVFVFYWKSRGHFDCENNEIRDISKRPMRSHAANAQRILMLYLLSDLIFASGRCDITDIIYPERNQPVVFLHLCLSFFCCDVSRSRVLEGEYTMMMIFRWALRTS